MNVCRQHWDNTITLVDCILFLFLLLSQESVSSMHGFSDQMMYDVIQLYFVFSYYFLALLSVCFLLLRLRIVTVYCVFDLLSILDDH